jgi:hypothetical protein
MKKRERRKKTMASKITLNNKEKKAIAIDIMQKLQTILSGNFEGNETLSLQIPHLKVDTAVKPKIIISTEAGLKMHTLVSNCAKEIGWHGFVERIDDMTYKITDIVVYPQTVTGTTVTVDELDYAQWLMTLSTEQVRQMRFQGHSHVNMACNPSPVDTDLYNKYLASLKEDDFYIFFICNKHGSLTAFLYDLKTNTKYNTSDIEIIKETDKSSWWNEVKAMIKETKPITVNQSTIFKHDSLVDDIYYQEQLERHSGFGSGRTYQEQFDWPARTGVTGKSSKGSKKGAKK